MAQFVGVQQRPNNNSTSGLILNHNSEQECLFTTARKEGGGSAEVAIHVDSSSNHLADFQEPPTLHLPPEKYLTHTVNQVNTSTSLSSNLSTSSDTTSFPS